MSFRQNFILMGVYNRWMNGELYERASHLSSAELVHDRGAFFGSILGTCNHLLVGDTIWLKRFSEHPREFRSLRAMRSWPEPAGLSEIVHDEFLLLWQDRQQLDSIIMEFVDETVDIDYEQNLTYKNTQGKLFCKNFAHLVQHFFNHQTHHRGQLTTLFSQIGVENGTTDLLTCIPEVETLLGPGSGQHVRR